MSKLDIMDYMITYDNAKDFFELTSALFLEDIHKVLGEEDFLLLLKIRDLIKDDDTQVQFWGTLDKLLSSERPPIEYMGVIRKDKSESVMETCTTHSKHIYSKNVSKFLNNFNNLNKSPLLSMLFFVFYDSNVDEIEVKQMEENGATEDEIMEYYDSKDIGNDDFNIAIDILLPEGHSISRMNEILDIIRDDDKHFNDDVQDIYFIDGIDVTDSVNLEFISSEFLDFAEYISEKID